ncbi:MAG: hypothetical protein WBE89_04720, partial [Methyloceanibacter sp.]
GEQIAAKVPNPGHPPPGKDFHDAAKGARRSARALHSVSELVGKPVLLLEDGLFRRMGRRRGKL